MNGGTLPQETGHDPVIVPNALINWMRIMTMCILLLLPLCALVYADSEMPRPCFNLREEDYSDQFDGPKSPTSGTFYCKPAGDFPRIFMVNSMHYWYLKCDNSGWSGLPFNQYIHRALKVAGPYSELTASCVEYCIAQAGEGVVVTPNTKDKIIEVKVGDKSLVNTIKEQLNQVECSDENHALYYSGSPKQGTGEKYVQNVKCDSRGWYYQENTWSFTKNLIPQYFECRPAPPKPCNIFIGAYRLAITEENGVSHMSCWLNKLMMIGSAQYSFVKCDASGLWGASLVLHNGFTFAKVSDGISKVTVSCVEYCKAHASEGVKTTPNQTMRINPISDSKFTIHETVNQVGCYDQTHGLFHDGKQVENNYAKCDARGWYTDEQHSPFAENTRPQQFECRTASVNPEPFTTSTTLRPIVPPSPMKDIPKPCNIIRGVPSDQVVSERDGSKVNKLYCFEVGNTQKMIMIGSERYDSLSCDNSGWKGKPIGWKEGANLVEIIGNNPVLTISCVDYSGEAPVTATPPIIPDKDICNKNNIRGVSLDQLIFKVDYKSKQKMVSDTTTRVQCKQIGNAARNIFIGSTQYWFITCNEAGWKGAPIGWQDSSDLLVITNDYEFLTMSCVEYCEARVDEGVNITSELTSKDVNYEYGDFSLKENFKRVECNEQTHSLFNNGEHVNSNHAECDARGWSTSALKKLPFDISKAQHFECRNANAPEPSATTTTEQTTTITKQTTTTEGPVASAQNSLVIICASLGGILLLAIIVIAVICVMRSSKNKESENVDNEMDTEIDVQMEDRGGSEHTEAESVVSEI